MKGFVFVACLVLGLSAHTAFVNGCGELLSGESGEFKSPNHPNSYPNGADCEWTISVPAGQISLTFSDVDIESSYNGCAYDSVKVYDVASNNLLTTLCGTSGKTVDGTSNAVRVVFVSDSSVTKNGFVARWNRVTCNNKGLQCVADSNACGNGEVKSGLFCENGGVCCQPPFEQGECGVITPTPTLIGGMPRIVGGDEATPHSWPWQVSLRTQSSDFHFCGGSLISDRWVVTAAHCVEGQSAGAIKVVTGDHDVGTSSANEDHHDVTEIKMHESYDGNGAGFPNDIALLRLADTVTMNSYRRPICLPEANDLVENQSECFITGWGNTQDNRDPDVLYELSVRIWPQSECEQVWGTSSINSGHVCVATGSEGACNGDSGGPLACATSRGGQTKWVLGGATSWGRTGCQTAGYPSVYSRVTFFKQWILDNVN